MASEPTAIAIAPLGSSGSLRVLIERLTNSGVQVAIVDDVPGAAEVARQAPSALPAVLIDLRDLTLASDIEDVKHATELIRRTCAAIPHVRPIVVTGEADVAAVIACIRAGAGDVIDLKTEGTAAARSVVQRIFHMQLDRAFDAQTASQLRAMIEELLKDLIRTERRSIDLEASLVAARSGQMPTFAEIRQPVVLVIDSDPEIADALVERLELAGISTFAYVSGEDALREADKLVATGGVFDLALVSVRLPGADGLETVRRLRNRFPGLPAFFMAEGHDAGIAENAADLGVAGFVHKPLADLDEVVNRVAELATQALHRTREHVYLERIKARHERVLARYRALPREA